MSDAAERAAELAEQKLARPIEQPMPRIKDGSADRWLGKEPAPIEFTIEDLVPEGMVTLLIADGGAGIYAATIRRLHIAVPGCSVGVLIPDFKGDEEALRVVMDAKPAILGHNLETVERLHPDVRPGGRYWRSISFLGAAKRIDAAIISKTGLILGMGEEAEEIRQALADLREAAVDILTLGQYLRPSMQHIPVARWVTPAEFSEWKRVGEEDFGFKHVEAGPLVRSSYHAKEQAREVEAGGPGSIQRVLEADLQAPAEILPVVNFVQLEMGRPERLRSAATVGWREGVVDGRI